jgi:hypothetical protein
MGRMRHSPDNPSFSLEGILPRIFRPTRFSRVSIYGIRAAIYGCPTASTAVAISIVNVDTTISGHRKEKAFPESVKGVPSPYPMTDIAVEAK